MSISERLKTLNLPSDSLATLTMSEGTDVFHFNETEIDTALAETSVVSELASLVVNSGLTLTNRWSGNVMEHLREGGFLEDYERGTFTFEEYLVEAITDNFYDVELVDYSTEKYDHKRGFTTLTTEVQVPVSELIERDPCIAGWKVSVSAGDMNVSFVA